MFIGKVCYVTTPYNENVFRFLLERHLGSGANTPPSQELISSVIAAYLEIKENPNKEMVHFEGFLKEQKIEIADHRSFTNQKVVGNPLEAILAFNEIYLAYLANSK